MSSLFFLSQFKPFFHSSHPDLTLSKLRPSGIWTIAAFGRTSQPDNGPWARFLDAWMEGGAEVLESNNFDRPYEPALTTPRPPTGGSRLARNGNPKWFSRLLSTGKTMVVGLDVTHPTDGAFGSAGGKRDRAYQHIYSITWISSHPARRTSFSWTK